MGKILTDTYMYTTHSVYIHVYWTKHWLIPPESVKERKIQPYTRIFYKKLKRLWDLSMRIYTRKKIHKCLLRFVHIFYYQINTLHFRWFPFKALYLYVLHNIPKLIQIIYFVIVTLLIFRFLLRQFMLDFLLFYFSLKKSYYGTYLIHLNL